jgi:hypothetical protein
MNMESQLLEQPVEKLEAEHLALKRRIALLVDQASRGEGDGAEIPGLTKQAASLTARIAEAKDEQEKAVRERSRVEREETRAELTRVLPAAVEQREAFLEHYRAACVALGRYVDLQTRAGHLTNQLVTYFGILPEDQNALQALQLGNRPREILDGLEPDMGAGWQMSFAVGPMHEKFKTR